jgi:hypothetical protein
MRAGFGKRLLLGPDQMYWAEAIGMAVDAIDSARFLKASEKRDIFYGDGDDDRGPKDLGAHRRASWARLSLFAQFESCTVGAMVTRAMNRYPRRVNVST